MKAHLFFYTKCIHAEIQLKSFHLNLFYFILFYFILLIFPKRYKAAKHAKYSVNSLSIISELCIFTSTYKRISEKNYSLG